jgi:hypothetical protein
MINSNDLKKLLRIEIGLVEPNRGTVVFFKYLEQLLLASIKQEIFAVIRLKMNFRTATFMSSL